MDDLIYPEVRDIDGLYFRVKRGDEYSSLCFTDLTEKEQEEIVDVYYAAHGIESVKRLLLIIAKDFREVCDGFDIINDPDRGWVLKI